MPATMSDVPLVESPNSFPFVFVLFCNHSAVHAAAAWVT